MYEKSVTLPTSFTMVSDCCESKIERGNICEKAHDIHELTKLIFSQATTIRGNLIGYPENKQAVDDTPIVRLKDELESIHMKLTRIHDILAEIGLNL